MVLKTDSKQMSLFRWLKPLVSSISNFFTYKTYLAKKWLSGCSNLALGWPWSGVWMAATEAFTQKKDQRKKCFNLFLQQISFFGHPDSSPWASWEWILKGFSKFSYLNLITLCPNYQKSALNLNF